MGSASALSLARAILKDAPILLLDEPTSALDTESEALVQEALERFMRGRTTIVVAHRLSTIRDADRVLVLEGGRIVEQGSHDELMSRHGRYRELYLRQFDETSRSREIQAGNRILRVEDLRDDDNCSNPTTNPLAVVRLSQALARSLFRQPDRSGGGAHIERMFVAYVIKLFVDSIIRNPKLDLLWYSVKIWLLFLVAWIPLNVLLSYSVALHHRARGGQLRQTIFSHMQRLPLGYHEQRHSGDLVSVMTNDITAAEQAFQQDMLNLVNASLQAVSAVVFMLVLNWQLALVIIASGLLPLVVNTLFARPLRKAGEAIQGTPGRDERAPGRPAGRVPGGAHFQPGRVDRGTFRPGQPRAAGSRHAPRAPGCGAGGEPTRLAARPFSCPWVSALIW